jgi:hypothetical protein
MKCIVRHSRLALLVALLALGGLGLAASPAPAAHAGSTPSITAQGGAQVFYVNGTDFTPNGKVMVQVYDSTWIFVTNKYTTALGPHFVCHTSSIGTICGLDQGGEVGASFVSQPGTFHMLAYDVSSGTWSNWSTAHVIPIP